MSEKIENMLHSQPQFKPDDLAMNLEESTQNNTEPNESMDTENKTEITKLEEKVAQYESKIHSYEKKLKKLDAKVENGEDVDEAQFDKLRSDLQQAKDKLDKYSSKLQKHKEPKAKQKKKSSKKDEVTSFVCFDKRVEEDGSGSNSRGDTGLAPSMDDILAKMKGQTVEEIANGAKKPDLVQVSDNSGKTTFVLDAVPTMIQPDIPDLPEEDRWQIKEEDLTEKKILYDNQGNAYIEESDTKNHEAMTLCCEELADTEENFPSLGSSSPKKTGSSPVNSCWTGKKKQTVHDTFETGAKPMSDADLYRVHHERSQKQRNAWDKKKRQQDEDENEMGTDCNINDILSLMH